MHGVASIWLRNFLYFRKSLVVTFFWAAFEPVLYLFAIGFSLGKSIGTFEGVTYIEFYVPALLTTTAMMVAYFESTFGSFTKLQYQKTYATIFLTPIRGQEIVIGEVLWCASKGAFGFTCVGVVAYFFKSLSLSNLLLVFVVLFLTSFMFASMGMLVASLVRNYDSFTYSVSGFIVPMSLFSGTYFPIHDLPMWIQNLAQILPLTHSVHVVRELMLDRADSSLLLNLLYIFILTIICIALAAKRITAKLEN